MSDPALRNELRDLCRSVYIVNEKRSPSYDRMYKIYVVFKDGTSMFDASSHTEWAADDEAALNRALRKVINMARAFCEEEE